MLIQKQFNNSNTVFKGVAGGADNIKIRLQTIFEKSKETVLELYTETANVLRKYING